MPELPEVETIKRGLASKVVNHKINKIRFFQENILKNTSAENFQSKLLNKTINNIRRRGKYLIIDVEDTTIVIHLRMEGKFFLDDKDESSKHTVFIFELDNGLQLRYEDVRKFSTIELAELHKENDLKSVNKLGFEPFDEQVTVDYLRSKYQKTTKKIKPLLLEQTIITGIGNIYVDEILFASKIHPETSGRNLLDEQLLAIITNTREILQKSIDVKGTTIRTYRSLDSQGSFQNYLKVHTKKGEKCPVCETEIIKIKVGGRGTYLCEKCQTNESK